eukprot:CAMPEP_0170215802 /NCGR_PEP_ID=MMETSP0116_2-20130129/7540_1 /TAXON_ID=400756 /ORGANISM="Durinskia baltica, Strain CSIRO CS-38" /LENGTH=173 /DNA_ID=CAMNT_0010466383 /DNA_START=61 /DNA_END=583 /DNA_ORIENTATION=+
MSTTTPTDWTTNACFEADPGHPNRERIPKGMQQSVQVSPRGSPRQVLVRGRAPRPHGTPQQLSASTRMHRHEELLNLPPAANERSQSPRACPCAEQVNIAWFAWTERIWTAASDRLKMLSTRGNSAGNSRSRSPWKSRNTVIMSSSAASLFASLGRLLGRDGSNAGTKNNSWW